MIITPDQHGAICRKLFARPTASAAAKIYDGYMAAMDSSRYADLIAQFEITTLERVFPWLATGAHESGGFRIMYESGTYTSAERILEIFGEGRHSAAITPAEARKLVCNPVALFERTYGLGNPEKAIELGNTQKGDGWRFRGTGIDQITGRRAHEKYAAEIGCSLDALAEPINSIHAALLEWREKGCNDAADAGDLRRVRKLINGGYNGWEDFEGKCALIKKAFLAYQPDLFPEYLSLGDRGPDVRKLQEDLRARGFYETGQLDDVFGPMTRRALVAFQVAHGIEPSGIYDKPTQTAMSEAPPEPTLPGRKAAEPKPSIIDRIAARLDAIYKLVLSFLGISTVAEGAGLQPIEKMVSAVEKTQSIFTKLSIQPRFVVYAIAALSAIMIFKWVRAMRTVTIQTTLTGKPAA